MQSYFGSSQCNSQSVWQNVNNRLAGLISVIEAHVFQSPSNRRWVVLQPYIHGWSEVGKYSVDVQGL